MWEKKEKNLGEFSSNLCQGLEGEREREKVDLYSSPSMSDTYFVLVREKIHVHVHVFSFSVHSYRI